MTGGWPVHKISGSGLMECVVHIGTEKTGTTSIQKTLDANAGRLEKAGIVWPPMTQMLS